MARSLNVLILDADAKGRDTLAYGFRGEGLAATPVATPDEARARLAESPLDVVLVVLRDAVDAVDEGLALLHELRRDAGSHPGGDKARLPLVVLGPPPLRPEVEALGDAGFLPLPVFVRDAVTATRLVGLRREGRSSVAPGTDGDGAGVVQGALSDFGVFFLLRTMLALGRTGILQVDRANRRGEVRFIDGDVVAAQVGTLQGQAALHQLLLWEEAALELRFRPVARRGQSFKKGEELLEETERFLRDFTHATKDIGPVASLFVQDPSKAAEAVDAIPAEVVPVLRLFDGHRTLGDVLEDSPFRVFDTLRIVSRLIEAAVIRRKAIEKPSGGARTARVDEWLNRAPDADVIKASPRGAGAAESATADQRVGAGSRRRAPRSAKAKQTAEHATVPQAAKAPRTTGMTPKPVPLTKPSAKSQRSATPKPAPATKPSDEPRGATTPAPAGVSRGPAPAASGELRVTGTISASTSGELSLSGTSRPSQRAVPVVTNAPSVVIDLSPEEIAAARGPAEERTPPPLSASSPPPPRATGVHAAEITAARAPLPTSNTASSGPSIQLSDELVSDMDAYELATSPPTPPPTLLTPPSTQPYIAQPGPITPRPAGILPLAPAMAPPLAAAPIPAPTLPARQGTPPAVVTPPMAPRQATPPPALAPQFAPAPATPEAPRSPAPPFEPAAAMPAAVAPPPRRRAPSVPPSGMRRPSGEFNALEADFFAREADLYKDDATEAFDDLTGPHGPKER